ncbi:ABC-type sugar transport system, periplasmic component [Sphaerochaeta pleomorpha str. Grapes]|uniref:ABC-type sugar transport system, periplasmic component n=1 Tax=Sphaerochaeta pleomorpha (strain ATCC BAA-1885 / DSM 22778 / Grapes) TaxID=158190 RepID=G8QSU0_SPHPG|nr:arabinose ABC transporter substrate-binding protein [Sphaerochaeta pleomorpha]AEV30122.1 ABC-type sugar transport system, periplasmic component [Sphaerochaeta pleomorpha str. Grapes]
MKRKMGVLLLLVLCSVGMLFANGSKEATAKSGKPVIYGIYKAGDQTWFIDEGASAKVAAEAAGYDFIYVDAKMSPEEYLRALDNAIANKAAGIVTCTPDQTMSSAIMDKMNDAGIPVVAADDALETDGKKIAPWVGINAYVIGEANGAWLANYAKENNLVTNPEVGLLLMTMDTVSSCVPRAKGEYAKFVAASPEFPKDRIFYADYDGTTDKGNQVSSAVFTAHPEIKTWLVTGANEEGTIGAVRALESAGLDKTSCVVGLGAYMAKDEFKAPGGSAMKAAAYFSSESVGAGSVKVLLDVINGKTVPMETAVDAVVVTPQNYREVMGKYAD